MHHHLTLFLANTKRKPGTRALYKTVLDQFEQYCRTHVTLSAVEGQPLFVAALDFLQSWNLQPRTHNLYLSIITTFLNERRLITERDLKDLHDQRKQIEEPLYSEHALTEEQKVAFFTYLRKKNARTNPLRQQRDLCIFLLQYACAMRIGEVCSLRRTDIENHPADERLTIRIRRECSKNGIERILPLRYTLEAAGIRIADELLKYLDMTQDAERAEVFFNLRSMELGTPIRTARMISKFNSIKRRLGMGISNSTHSMRHTRITEIVNAGAPMPVASTFAGHFTRDGKPNTNTTIRYLARPKTSDVAKWV